MLEMNKNFIIETEDGNIFLSDSNTEVETDTVVTREEVEDLIEDNIYAIQAIEDRLDDRLPSNELVHYIQKIVLNKALQNLKEEYLGKRVNLDALDSKMYEFANNSIFQGDMPLGCKNYCWMYENGGGFNFFFDSLDELIEDENSQDEIYVTVEGIELI